MAAVVRARAANQERQSLSETVVGIPAAAEQVERGLRRTEPVVGDEAPACRAVDHMEERIQRYF